ncbi:hypothetical protein DSO57_1001174 [Entomophthora muscae]|uniref:Uncharacterized protein n=1 Tax=Entomophthora muscae TaxID=34485 RepID=A0ACC2TW97_9FUNG|nr:hypothetical protein DSO57_1001174 [Entomophthora muscae]
MFLSVVMGAGFWPAFPSGKSRSSPFGAIIFEFTLVFCLWNLTWVSAYGAQTQKNAGGQPTGNKGQGLNLALGPRFQGEENSQSLHHLLLPSKPILKFLVSQEC